MHLKSAFPQVEEGLRQPCHGNCSPYAGHGDSSYLRGLNMSLEITKSLDQSPALEFLGRDSSPGITPAGAVYLPTESHPGDQDRQRRRCKQQSASQLRVPH